MSGGGLARWTPGLDSTDPDYFAEVALGNFHGRRIMSALGERLSMGTTTAGEDIWRGSATSVPTPPDIGEQMDVESTDAADTDAGTGVQEVRVHYIDSSGEEQIEDVITNGITPVPLVASDVRFVNDFYAIRTGSNGVAEGSITIFQQGDDTRIYNLIFIGGNKSLVPHRMVPVNKRLILKGWQATEAQSKRVALRIRSTDMYGVLIPGVYCFKGTAFIKASATGELKLNSVIPALSIVKVSGWPVVSGAEASCSWWGMLVDDGY